MYYFLWNFLYIIKSWSKNDDFFKLDMMLPATWTPFGITDSINGYLVFFLILKYDASSFHGVLYHDNIVANPEPKALGSWVALDLVFGLVDKPPVHLFFDEFTGMGIETTSGCSSTIIRVGEESTTYIRVVLVMDTLISMDVDQEFT